MNPTAPDVPDSCPALATATDPIASVDDLRQRWRAVLGELGFAEHLLRFAFVGPDRRMIKVLSDVPLRGDPTRRLVDGLTSSLAGVLAGLGDGHSVAFLLVHPGGGGVSGTDRRWATALAASAAAAGVALEPVFRADDEAVRLVSAHVAAA